MCLHAWLWPQAGLAQKKPVGVHGYYLSNVLTKYVYTPRTPVNMFLTASKKLSALEQQLASICMAIKELQGDLESIAISRRHSCRNAYHKDIHKSRHNQKLYYQRCKSKRSAKMPCAHCGALVRADYMLRHMRTARCVAAKLKAPLPIPALEKPPDLHLVQLSLVAP